MAKFPQCPRIDWTREEKKIVFFSTTVQQLNQLKRECYSLKYFENLFQNMLNNECEIQAHNPYTKSFQYWHSVFERILLSLRGLVSINNRRHSVSILIDQWVTITLRVLSLISQQSKNKFAFEILFFDFLFVFPRNIFGAHKVPHDPSKHQTNFRF